MYSIFMKNIKATVWESKSKPGQWHIKIEEQSNRGKNFAPAGNNFWEAANGIHLLSVDSPRWEAAEDTLYVRGKEVAKDFRVATVTAKEAKRIQEAIEEYNTKFGPPVVVTKWQIDNSQTHEIIYGGVQLVLSPKGVTVKSRGKLVTVNQDGLTTN